MIEYAVTVHIDSNAESDWLEWMETVHVPQVLQTGLFTCCRISKKMSDGKGYRTTYKLVYTCRSENDLQTYQEKFAPALQQDHTTRYEGRFSAERSLFRVIGQIKPD